MKLTKKIYRSVDTDDLFQVVHIQDEFYELRLLDSPDNVKYMLYDYATLQSILDSKYEELQHIPAQSVDGKVFIPESKRIDRVNTMDNEGNPTVFALYVDNTNDILHLLDLAEEGTVRVNNAMDDEFIINLIAYLEHEQGDPFGEDPSLYRFFVYATDGAIYQYYGQTGSGGMKVIDFLQIPSYSEDIYTPFRLVAEAKWN